jgi:hypothetical protein
VRGADGCCAIEQDANLVHDARQAKKI